MHTRGEVPELASADVVLCIDGYAALRQDFSEAEGIVTDLLQRGSGYGIHVVAGMLRWNDVRIATQSNFGQKVELHLNDPTESTIDRKLAETLPEGVGGMPPSTRARPSSSSERRACRSSPPIERGRASVRGGRRPRVRGAGPPHFRQQQPRGGPRLCAR